LRQLKKLTNNIIVIDNDSTDRTFTVAKKYCRVLKNEKNFGKGYSIRRGCREAKTPIIVMMDADLSHKPTDIQNLVKPLLQNKRIGLVVGSRSLGGSEEYVPSKLFGNMFFTRVFNFFWHTKFTDVLNGFKAFRKEITLDLRSNKYDIEVELVGACLRKGYEVKEIPTYEIARRSGKSKLNKIFDSMIILKQIFVQKYKSIFK
jgi:glycosyltransferase involved in cell wall biosynthesis